MEDLEVRQREAVAVEQRVMRYALREPVPRQMVTIEHTLGQYSVVGGELHELIEIASTVTGEWTLDHVWRPCKQ